MAGRIPQQFIQDLLARVDVVDLIDERLTLKKAGQNYTACCPFHNEKTPSFTVSREKQFYHCFGCGAHGSAISFLMEFDRLEFLDAVRQLAARVGVEIPREAQASGPSESYQALYDLLAQAAQWFGKQLREPVAQTAVDYLKKRGVTGSIAQEYGIGFAPPGWDHLLQHLGTSDEARRCLLQAGLVIEKEQGGYYDRFRNRIMFPIRDTRGRVIGFGGRVLGDDTPKYLNSPETPVFHKGSELYGLYEARKRTRDLAQIIVVEGYMDVVGLAQYGVNNAVATLGTATTKDHLDRLFRIASDVIFCFDGDNAGRQAAWRALEVALPLMTGKKQVRFMFLPEGEDPDTWVRQEGGAAFAQRSVNSIPLSTFLFEHLTKQADLTSIDGRARYVELARPLIAKVPAGVFRQMLTARLAELVHLEARQITHALGAAPPPLAEEPVRKSVPRIMGRTPLSPVRVAIKLLLHHPELAQHRAELNKLDTAELPGVTLLLQLMELLTAQPTQSIGMVLENWRDTEEGRHLTRLLQWEWPLPEQGVQEEFLDALRKIAAQGQEHRTAELLAKSQSTALTEKEKEELKQLFNSKVEADMGSKNTAPKNGRPGSH